MNKLQDAYTFNKWLTGFWEADGSIGVRTHNVDGNAYKRLEIELAQKDIAPLQFIKDTLELTINITMHCARTSRRGKAVSSSTEYSPS